MMYTPAENRYEKIPYARSGKSGLRLPKISLGLWQNFGDAADYEQARSILLHSFDEGITHFDLANNYGPPPGAAERLFGRVFKGDLAPWRDELIISTKAGFLMWPGPYGEWGSRKNLLSSLDQSLQRMGLDYVDIFYSHRPDVETPLEETMGALATAVQSGKALYVGISNYTVEQTREASRLLREWKVPCLIHQPAYNMFNRWIEPELSPLLEQEGIGCIVYSPLAQGLLTNRYLQGIPKDSRAARPNSFLPEKRVEEKLPQIQRLNTIAQARGQTLAQLAISWVLRNPVVTSALIGASRISQVDDCLGALKAPALTDEELKQIEAVLNG
jgi:L-glyceraldehyde 3-phosphate reductase